MSRSRSSFDLSGAIATAASLSVVVPEEQPAALRRGMPLVSFGPTDPTQLAPAEEPAQPAVATEETPKPPAQPVEAAASPAEAAPREATPVPAAPAEPPTPVPAEEARPAVEAAPAEIEPGPAETARRPPKLPDLSEIKSPVVRCQKIIEWIVEAVGASEVFIADAAGLPIAGAITDVESRLGATGVVASAAAHLAAAIPGNSSALFEMHLGDGPFFQLIGFEVAGHAGGRLGAPSDTQSYVVGFHRPTPLGFRQAHAVRLACHHALSAGREGAEPHTPGADLSPVTDPRGPRSAMGEPHDPPPAPVESGGET